jgi:hypothetical protein
MFEVLTATVLVLAASALGGSTICRLAGLPRPAGVAPAVGFAALLTISAVTIRLPGRAGTTAAVLAVLLTACAVFELSRRPLSPPPAWAPLTAIAVVALAMLPFASVGHVGLLGAGTNDDSAEHLLAAWALQGHTALNPSKLVSSGYPVGPHALLATIAGATGISLEHGLTGILLAVPAMLAVAAGALVPTRHGALRGVLGAAVGLCYLQSGFLVQASFKEPMEALMLVAFAAVLTEIGAGGGRATPEWRRALPLGVLGAGAVYIYSYPGLLWLVGTLAAWAAVKLGLAVRAGRARAELRASLPAALAAFAVFVLMSAPEVTRTVRFGGSGYNHEGSQVRGDLLHSLPALEGVGVWPRLDFRFGLPLGSAGGVLALFAVGALALSLLAAVRRRDLVLCSALAVAAAIYGLSATRSPYTGAKGLAILAPLVTLMLASALAALLEAGPARRGLRALAAGALAVVLGAGAYSDLELLRDGPVGPDAHAAQLAALRPLIGRAPTLFLGADDFVHWELRGALVATPPQPLYTRVVVPMRLAKTRIRSLTPTLPDRRLTLNRFAGLDVAFDFDSVPPSTLDRYTFAIVPRTAYASAAPPNWHRVAETASFTLWRRRGPTPYHDTLREIGNPGAILNCRAPAGRALAERGGIARASAPGGAGRSATPAGAPIRCCVSAAAIGQCLCSTTRVSGSSSAARGCAQRCRPASSRSGRSGTSVTSRSRAPPSSGSPWPHAGSPASAG